jgi:hypothetical protein
MLFNTIYFPVGEACELKEKYGINANAPEMKSMIPLDI